MAKPLKPSVNHSDVPKRSKQFSKCNKVKKVRIICSDPYATESSGDEIESEGATKKIKRCVREIKFCDSLCLNWSSVKKSRKNGKMQKNSILSKAPLTSEGRVLQFFGNSTAKERPNRSLYRGVRQRKSGKWAAEIRNPFEQRRLWLGTYNSPEEASRVYEAKRQEFVSKARNMAKGNSKWSMGEFSDDVASPHFQNQQHVVPEDSEALSQASSPASVLELNTGAVNADFDCDSLPKESADVDTDENNEIVEGCPAADPVQKKAMFMELENTPLDPEIDFQFFDDIRKLDDSSDPHVFPVFDIKLEGEMRLHDNFFDTAEFPPWMDLSRDPWTP